MFKSGHGPGLLFLNKYDSYLSNEVLCILLGQEAAKISEVKDVSRKILPTWPDSTLMQQIIFRPLQGV